MTAAEIVTEAIPHSNIDTNLFSRYIFPAQAKYMWEFLGETYYEELDGEIQGSSLTADNSVLLNNWLKPALAYLVLHDAAPQIRTELVSAGFVNNLTETGEIATDKSYADVRSSFMSQAQTYLNLADRYVKEEKEDDSTKYPNYKDQDVNNDGTNIVIY